MNLLVIGNGFDLAHLLGAVKDKTYRYEEQTYTIVQHRFARDKNR